jgi:thiol:disulfide interchange protein
MPEAVSWPPGWFPDPTGRHDHRWWDGAEWTGHVADAGVASLDGLPAPSHPTVSTRSTGGGARAAGPGNDPVAVASLAVALGSVLLSLVPGLGLVLPVVAITLAVIARARIRTSRRAGDGMAIAGLVVGIGSLLLAIVVSAFAAVLLFGSGGELAGAFAEYVACLEVRTPAECRVLLEESLARITG